MFLGLDLVFSVSVCVWNFCIKLSWEKFLKDFMDFVVCFWFYLYVDFRIWVSLVKCGWKRKR